MYHDTQGVFLHDMDNGKNGHCWIYVVLQALALEGGFPLATVESAFSQKRSDRLYNLCYAARRLTVAVLASSRPSDKDNIISALVGAMTGPKKGTSPMLIRRMALDYKVNIENLVDLNNTILYMDPKLGGGGNAGELPIRALAKGVGIELPAGPQEDVLSGYINGTTTAQHMALLDEKAGHWSLQVLIVSGKIVRF